MYILFRDKGICPGDYYKTSTGEKLLLAAFVQQMYDDREN